ncbi:MAG: choice-of-anchor L domain-containing protein [Bacteroidales bacterium]|nr:choice-of-anchor L domain-containing protein [Bacteroidales bacterium]
MKKILFLLLIAYPFLIRAQVVCTSQNGQSAQSVVENYFLGGGVEVSNVRFNGQLNVNSNQFGTFTNIDTSGQNIKLNSGLIIATGDILNAAAPSQPPAGYSTVPPSDGNNVSPSLYYLLQQLGLNYAMNDVGVLSFDFVPQGDRVSFKYVFASDEYQSYVCSQFNDAFGFFISGPFDENGNFVNIGGITPYINENIAIIPGSNPELPVTINTVNSGNPSGSVQPCVLSNTHLHILQSSETCNRMIGYTIALETKRVDVAPCYKYRIEMATCNVSDHSLPSAVFLGANSFKVDEFQLSAQVGGVTHGDTVMKASCSSTTVRSSLNRPAEAGDAYTFRVEGDMVEGVDYQSFGNTLTFPVGDTMAEVTINFISSPNDVPGQVKTMYIITEARTECSVDDTITVRAVVPQNFVITNISDNKVYCDDVLPQREMVFVNVENPIGNVTYSWQDPDGNPIGENPNSDTNYITITQPIIVTINVSDECDRTVTRNIQFSKNTATTVVSSDKDKICEGDSIILSCTNATSCIWTSTPADIRLAQNNTSINPVAMPSSQTTYSVTIIDANGCQAQGQVSVQAYPAVTAKMSLNPNKLTYINNQTQFSDQTANAFSRLWDFGDGTTSTLENGYHSYPNNIEEEYDVVLVAYNEALCPDTARGKIIVKPDFGIYVPSAFTPGAANANSYFVPITSSPVDYEFSIYNRWGERIFYTNRMDGSKDEKAGWDGKLKDGNYAPDGTYVWYLIYKDGDGKLQSKNGSVTLVKGK